MKPWLLICPIRNKKFCNSGAFTLVEVLLVAVIFAFIAAGVAASFVSGMKLWGRAKELVSYRGEALIGVELMAHELRQSADVAQIGFLGNSSRFYFPQLNGDNISKVSYAFNPQDKLLTRKSVQLSAILSGKEDEQSVEKNIFSADEVTFQYLYFDLTNNTYTWKGSWEKAGEKFRAVRFYVKAHGKELNKTVFVPISQ